MATVHDVAKYILNEKGSMTTWKLQKLVYYSQAWHLVWDEEALFDEPIEAWANGPVVRSLYDAHRGRYTVSSGLVGGKVGALNQSQRETIDAVLRVYGDKTGHWLSELTHAEEPWRKAREGMSPTERGNRRIRRDVMTEYYGQLVASS